MPDTFTRIEQDLEEEGSGGIARELREAGERTHAVWLNKLKVGQCKNMESVADAVGFIRGLEFFLKYAENKAQKAQAEMRNENEED